MSETQRTNQASPAGVWACEVCRQTYSLDDSKVCPVCQSTMVYAEWPADAPVTLTVAAPSTEPMVFNGSTVGMIDHMLRCIARERDYTMGDVARLLNACKSDIERLTKEFDAMRHDLMRANREHDATAPLTERVEQMIQRTLELDDVATPKPWALEGEGFEVANVDSCVITAPTVSALRKYVPDTEYHANIAAVAEYRTLAPALAIELRATRERLQAAISDELPKQGEQ